MLLQVQLCSKGGWNAIRYQILDPLKNIRYQGTPVPPPPPPLKWYLLGVQMIVLEVIFTMSIIIFKVVFTMIITMFRVIFTKSIIVFKVAFNIHFKDHNQSIITVACVCVLPSMSVSSSIVQ